MGIKSKSGNKGGKIFLCLFGLPFLLVGLYMTYKTGKEVTQWIAIKAYDQVPARIFSLYVDSSSSSEGGTTYQLKGSFEYQFNNRYYRSDTITQYDGYDNVGDFHHDIYRKINNSKDGQGMVTAFVNPKDPNVAYLDNTFRWAILGFNSVFIIVFGGIGAAMVFGSYFYKGDDDVTKPEYAATPWRAKNAWKTDGPLFSDGKIKMYVFCAFALFWNAISSFIPFVIYDEAIKGNNHAAWIAALFPLAGLGIFLVALREVRNWRKFGKCPMVLEPFPAEYGGLVKGYIDINIPFDGAVEYKVAIKNQYHYVSGSGKNRSSNTRDVWADYATARAEGSLAGTRVHFEFTTPAPGAEGTRETEITDSSTYYGWVLHFKADFPGKLDFDRSYDIPVFKKR